MKRTLSRTSTISSQSSSVNNQSTDTEDQNKESDSAHINFDASSLDESNVNPPHVGEQINLDCFDLASCYQSNKRKFMLIQAGFILLIDPDPKVLGWAIIRKVLSLSRIQIKRTNDTTLQVTVDNKNSAGNLKNITEVFTFEDQIRCTAVYARIGRGRDLFLRDRQNWLSNELGIAISSGVASPIQNGTIQGPYSVPHSALEKSGNIRHIGGAKGHNSKNISRNAQNRHYLAYSRANQSGIPRGSNNNVPSIPSSLISGQATIRTIQPMKGEIKRNKHNQGKQVTNAETSAQPQNEFTEEDLIDRIYHI